MSKSKSEAPVPLFTDGEKVLCFHGPLIYEGKVLKVELKGGVYQCFIHYAGWSKKWDEFVPETRVLKWSPENLKRQKEHKLAHEDSVRSNKKVSLTSKPPLSVKKKTSIGGEETSSGNVSTTDSRPSTPTLVDQHKSGKSGTTALNEPETEVAPPPPPTKKRKVAETVEQQERIYHVKQEVKFPIPQQLRTTLLDDWDAISRLKKLVNTPARITVDTVLEKFLATKPDDMFASLVCGGIKDYFNAILGSQLLYRFERFQYSEVMSSPEQTKDPERQMSAVYGPIHLLRLFTKLGTCLSYTTLGPEAVRLLTSKVEDLFQFLLENMDEYFCSEDYGMSAPEYQRRMPV